MLTFLDRLLPHMARLARRADLAAPVFGMVALVVTRFRLAIRRTIRRGVTDLILPATLKEAP